MPYFLGIKGIEFVWHGEWADPEVIYKNRSFDVWSVQEELEDAYDAYVRDRLIRPYKGGWEEWAKKNPRSVKALLDDWVYQGVGKPIKRTVKKKTPKKPSPFGL